MGDDAAIRAWIGQLTRRLCVDRLRTSGRTAPLSEVGEAAAEEPDLDRATGWYPVRSRRALTPLRP